MQGGGNNFREYSTGHGANQGGPSANAPRDLDEPGPVVVLPDTVGADQGIAASLAPQQAADDPADKSAGGGFTCRVLASGQIGRECLGKVHDGHALQIHLARAD